MKNLLPTLLLLSTVCVIAHASETPTRTETVIASSELAAIRARLDELEKVVARTGPDGENVELRAPSLHGSIALVDGGGNKIVDVAYREGIPNDFSALGFFGHAPMGQDAIQGDWSTCDSDEVNQCTLMGSLFDSIGTNTGFGLVKDMRANF